MKNKKPILIAYPTRARHSTESERKKIMLEVQRFEHMQKFGK